MKRDDGLLRDGKRKKKQKDVISFSNAGANGGSNCVFQLNEASR